MSDWIRVRVIGTQGSAPRETGAQMLVFEDRIEGSIGGGALEWDALHHARAMLRDGRKTATRDIALGPDMGQCCGGRVQLEFLRNHRDAPPLGKPLWIWGAGHVGQALARVMAPLEDRDVTLIDVSVDRMPDGLPQMVHPLIAADPLRVVPRADAVTDHIIVTYSHDLDLALCDALLRQGFGSCGLIGSATKWARFRKRLASMGHSDAQISRIACPIGDPSLGKHPQAIAIGVAASLLSTVAQLATGEKTG